MDKIREREGGKGGSRSSSSEGGVKGDGLLRDKGRQGSECGRRGGWCLCVCLSVLSHCRNQFDLRTVEQTEGDAARLALDTDTLKHREHKALMFKE